MTGRRQLRIWLIALALGAGAAALFAVIGFLGFFFVLLIVPGMSARTWLAAMSGALMGFGGVSLALLARPPDMGGAGDQGTIWMLLGVVPLVVGIALGALAWIASRDRPR
ncbi:MAG TPA: hypothetical protein VF253_00390 [Candidatus Limnocylindrales bacterium]